MIGGRYGGWAALATTLLLTEVLTAPFVTAGAAEAAAIGVSAPGTATMKDLGTLLGGTTSISRAINAQGQVAGDGDTAGGVGHAFRWTASGGMQDLGTLAGMDNSFTSGINAQGQIAGVHWYG